LKLLSVFKHSQKDVPNPEKQNHIFHKTRYENYLKARKTERTRSVSKRVLVFQKKA
jgi:hypothetical protein